MRQKTVAIAFLAAATTCAPAAAQTAGKQQPPRVAPERPFTFPAHTTTKLDNGLTVFVVEDHRQPVVSATLLLPAAGATAQADAKQAGLAGMTAALLRQGTAKRSAQQIAEAIDSIGGSLSAGANADATQASVTVMTSSLDAGFDLLADIVQRPAFAPDEIERWRRQMASGLQVSYSDPEYLRDVVSNRLAYGNHPYALPTDGTPQTLRGLTREAAVAFHKAHYSPAGAYLAIAGDITPAAAAAVVKKHFGAWTGPAPKQATLPSVPQPQRRVVVVDQPEAVQTQFGMLGLGVPRNHADWLPLTVGNQIFGGSFNSRLNLRLRAKEGLTYGAGSAIASSRHAGLWGATSFTRTEETANAMKVMMEVINDFRKNPATPAELSEATAYLSGVFAIQTETAAAVAGRVLTSALHGLPPDYWQTYRDRVRKVSAADVSGAVERHIRSEQLTIVAVGNAKAFAKTLEALGPVTIVPAASLDLTQPDLMVKPESAAGPDAAARGLAIVKAAAEAHGGAAKLSEIKDATVTSEITLSTPGGEMQGKGSAVILHPDRTRGTIALPFGEVVQVFDGTSGFIDVPGQGRMDMPPTMAPEMRRAVLLNAGVGVLREALAGGAQIAALESKAVDGVTLDRVSWKKGDLDMVLGFDPKTHQLVNVTYRGMTQQGMADTEMRLSNFKPAANGVLAPMRITTLQNGQQAVDVVVSEWKFNTGVSPDLFKK
jgi:predicted Zn-dependent peptidase/outer membrane lipoprotein-sorting protein